MFNWWKTKPEPPNYVEVPKTLPVEPPPKPGRKGDLADLIAKDPKKLTTGQKQRLFTYFIAKLILYAYEELGYQMSVGMFQRSEEEAARLGFKKSLHTKKLAGDLNLFIFGENDKLVYQTSTLAHRELGLKWESYHPLCTWGGRFNDGNHYSVTDGGIK